jgi:putative peptidoglycan lipid II flippase
VSTSDSSPTAQEVAAQAAQSRRTFYRAAMIVTTSVLLSRVLGFFREWALAHQVGSNALTDAYYAAFTIPDILNYLLAGGALSVTFVPVFLEYFMSRREEDAWRVFSTVLITMSALLLALLVIAEIHAPVLTMLLAPGFSPERQELVTRLTRIMLPAQAFFFVGGIMTAVQYAQNRFLIPSLAPLIYNGMIILFGILFSNRLGVEAFSWGVLAGSLIGNCLLQIYGALRASARFQLHLDWSHPGFRRFLNLTWPIMLGFSVIFIDDWAMRWFGSYLVAASISWLSYGKQLMRIVVGVFGQAAGVAAYPQLARYAAQQKWKEMHDSLEHALRHVILTVVPSSLLLALLSKPVVYLLFSRTKMGAADIEQTATVMLIFLLGAFAWAAQGIIGRGFYALGDTLTPTLVGSGLTLLTLPLYWIGARKFAHFGLAGASTVAVLVYTLGLWVVLYRRLKIPLAGTMDYLARTCAASIVAGVPVLLFLNYVGRNALTFPSAALQASLAAIVYLAVFGRCAALFGIAGLQDWKGLLPRRLR